MRTGLSGHRLRTLYMPRRFRGQLLHHNLLPTGKSLRGSCLAKIPIETRYRRFHQRQKLDKSALVRDLRNCNELSVPGSNPPVKHLTRRTDNENQQSRNQKRGNFCDIRTKSPRTQRTQSNFYLRGPDKEKRSDV